MSTKKFIKDVEGEGNRVGGGDVQDPKKEFLRISPFISEKV